MRLVIHRQGIQVTELTYPQRGCDDLHVRRFQHSYTQRDRPQPNRAPRRQLLPQLRLPHGLSQWVTPKDKSRNAGKYQRN